MNQIELLAKVQAIDPNATVEELEIALAAAGLKAENAAPHVAALAKRIKSVGGGMVVAAENKPAVKRGRKPKQEALAPLKDKAMEQGQGVGGRATDLVVQSARAGYESSDAELSAQAYVAGFQMRFTQTIAAGLGAMTANLGTLGAADEEAIEASLAGLAEGWGETPAEKKALDFWA